MFTLAIAWELLDGSNPCTGVRRNPEQNRERYLTADELARLVAVLDAWPTQRVPNLMRLALMTGARKSELLGLPWSELDLEAGVWWKPSSRTKNARVHRVPLSRPVVALLVDMKVNRGSSRFVFPGVGETRHMVDPQREWTRIRAAAGLTDFRMHDLRHSHASLAISSGSTLAVVGGLLGHRTAQQTQRYAHLMDHAGREASEKVSAIVTGADAEVIKIRR
jgi:integrase